MDQRHQAQPAKGESGTHRKPSQNGEDLAIITNYYRFSLELAHMIRMTPWALGGGGQHPGGEKFSQSQAGAILKRLVVGGAGKGARSLPRAKCGCQAG